MKYRAGSSLYCIMLQIEQYSYNVPSITSSHLHVKQETLSTEQGHIVQNYNAERCLGNTYRRRQSAAVHLALYRLCQHWRADHQKALWPPDVRTIASEQDGDTCQKRRTHFCTANYFIMPHCKHWDI